MVYYIFSDTTANFDTITHFYQIGTITCLISILRVILTVNVFVKVIVIFIYFYDLTHFKYARSFIYVYNEVPLLNNILLKNRQTL